MNMSPVSAHSDFAADQPFPGPFTRSVFPADAQATIYKTAPSPMTSGRPRAERWTLRSSGALLLISNRWWAGPGMMIPSHRSELSFPSAETVIAYARRQDLQYTVQGLPARGSKPRQV